MPSSTASLFINRFITNKLSSILLVDDDATTNFLNKLLHKMAVAEQLLVAKSGVEALATLARACTDPDTPACPALILLDVNMPVMNGLASLEAYQQLPWGSCAPPSLSC